MYYYCERTSADIFSEPLNSLTNLAFIFISYLIFKKYKNYKNGLIFSGLIFFIGLGSFLLHTIPSKITALIDVIFILFFIIFFLYILYKNVLKTKIIYALFLSFVSPVLYFYLGSSLKENFPLFGDSSFYIFILLNLILIYFYLLIKNTNFSNYILIASIIFLISIFFRIIDQVYCDINFYGTHFLWHILNSLVLFYLVRFSISNLYFLPKNTNQAL